MNVTTLRTITVERALRPAGFFTVTMCGGQFLGDDFSAWESAEMAFAEADHLKRDYGPAVIRDRTGGAR